MQVDPLSLATILGMALATYATRAVGLWLMGRISPSARTEAWLKQIPSAVLVSIVAPAVISGGAVAALGAAATALVAVRTRNLLLAMVAGVGVVVVLRAFG